MAGVNPYQPVPAPLLVPGRYGLYSAAAVLDTEDGIWENGIIWDDSDNCSSGGIWQPCCGTFVDAPVEVKRRVGVTTVITARPAIGGGAEILVQASDDWTGAPIPGISVTVGILGPTVIATSDAPAVLGTLLAGCATTQTVTVAIGADSKTTPLVITADTDPEIPCTGRAVIVHTVEVAEPTDAKAFSDSTFTIGDPFAVYDGRICPGRNEDELKASARNRLAVTEQRQVEQMFWRGPNNPQLSDPSVPILTAAAVSPLMGVAALEGYLADHYLGTGLIHAPRYTAGLFQREQQIAWDLSSAVLRTTLGTGWVFGAGYPRVGPDGTTPPAGQSWIYATGAMVVRRSPIVNLATRDRTGCVTGLAERYVVLAVQCGIRAAALVNFNLCDCTGTAP